jgi:hypothetical protein
MPITPYLDGRTFDPGTERVTGDAFEMALAALRISNPSDHVAADRCPENSRARKEWRKQRRSPLRPSVGEPRASTTQPKETAPSVCDG